MRRATPARSALLVSAVLAFGTPMLAASPPNIALTLRNDFIHEFKNRATIDVDLKVVIAATSPHSVGSTSSEDGDLHVAAKATQVGLPMVSEVLHAANFSSS